MSTRSQSEKTTSGQKPQRYGLKWSVNEILRLQREYELLELNVKDISRLHNRTETSIINKLVSEGLVTDAANVRRF